MNRKSIAQLASLVGKHNKEFEITVTGISMLPALKEGDVVTVIKQEDYQVGDVIVFTYENDGLLIHRVMVIRKGIYYCRGDNAIRIEQVNCENIIGKAILI